MGMEIEEVAKILKRNVYGNAEFGQFFYDFEEYVEDLSIENISEVAEKTINDLKENAEEFGQLKSYKVCFEFTDKQNNYKITMTDKVNILR